MTNQNLEQMSFAGPCLACEVSDSTFVYKGMQHFEKEGSLALYGCSNCRASMSLPVYDYAARGELK